MANANDEHSSGADGDLENLPQGEREETKKILDEITGEQGAQPDKPGEEKPKPGEEAKKPEGEEAKKPAEGEVEAGKDKKPEGEQGKPARRDASLVPAWMLGMADSKRETAETKLADALKEIERLTAGKSGTDDKKGDEGKPAALSEEAVATMAKELAEKHGITPELATDLLKASLQGRGEIPTEVKKAIEDVHRLRDERAIEVEEARFSSDFDAQIVPLIKAEYGDDVPQETIADIKEKLKAVAYSPEYAKVPYSTIYKGQDDFRGVIPQKKRGAEASRGGSAAAGEAGAGNGSGKTADTPLGKPWDEYSDAEVEALDGDNFQKWSDHMAAHERKQGRK